MTVSLAEAMWRTKLASNVHEMRDVASENDALLPGDRVDLTRFAGTRATVPLAEMAVRVL